AVYETGTGRRLWQVPTHAAGAVFAPDEVAVALHESNGTVTIRDTQTGREVVRFDGSPRQADFERCHTVSADFRWVATLDGEGRSGRAPCWHRTADSSCSAAGTSARSRP